MLAVLEKHLGQHDWLVGERATIADLACYPYLMLAPDGGVDLSPYPGVRAWFERIERIRIRSYGMHGRVGARERQPGAVLTSPKSFG